MSFNPGTQGGRGQQIFKFKTSLLYIVSSRTVQATQRNPALKPPPQKKRKERERGSKEEVSKGGSKGGKEMCARETYSMVKAFVALAKGPEFSFQHKAGHLTTTYNSAPQNPVPLLAFMRICTHTCVCTRRCIHTSENHKTKVFFFKGRKRIV